MSGFLIDPVDITNYNYTDDELEVFWLFSICVAGKTARTQARLLDNFLNSLGGDGSPFHRIMESVTRDELDDRLKASRLGQYSRLSRAFRESLSVNLRICTVEDLEAIHGVGPKTSRLFIMHSRPNQRLAAIDTHVLHYLRDMGYDAPKITPGSSKAYTKWENVFLSLVDRSGMNSADFDLFIWKIYSGSLREDRKMEAMEYLRSI